MRNVLLGAATVLAIAGPTVAFADTNGYVNFSYNSLDDDNDSNKNDYLELGGAVAAPLSGSWNLQFDAAMQNMNHTSHSDSMSTVVAHAFSRDDSFAYGGFLGFTQGESSDAYLVGAEGALYFERFSLSGSAFWGTERENNSGNEISGAELSGAYFISDNFSVGADVSYYSFYDNDQDGTIYGINGEYLFSNNVSLFGGFHTSNEDYFGTDKQVDSITLGVRYNFGGSLMDRDRRGASMPGAESLHRAQVFGW